MKIVFKTLQSIDGVIQLSLDGGESWTSYSIQSIKENGGIPLSDEQDLSLIKIKSDNTILSKMEVISSIGAETVVNMSHVSDLVIDRSLKLDKKDSTENISVLDTMVAPQFVLQDRTMPLYSRNVLNIDPNSTVDPEGVISIQNILKDIPSMQSFGYYVLTTNTDTVMIDALGSSTIKNFENISYEYHSYDEYLRFLNNMQPLFDMDTILFDMDTISEGETKAVSGAHIQETDYIINASRQDGNITLSLVPGDFYRIVDGEEERVRLVFFKKITVQKIETEYSSINLNGTTIDFASCKEWKELNLDNVNNFIYKYDSENNILYSLIATTNNENVPDELKYGMIVYLNHGGRDADAPYDVWYSTNYDKGFDTYSFNFEFNDNVDIYMNYINTTDGNIWTPANEEGKSFFYALTSADKKGFRFIKDSYGTIRSEQFDFSTISEYTPAVSFVKKDSYSLYKKVVDKVPQIKIEGQLPKEDSIIFVNNEGEPSFITISELITKLGIK